MLVPPENDTSSKIPTIMVIAERLSARHTNLAVHVLGRKGVVSRSGMQFFTLRNAPKSCIHLRKFIFLSAVAALVVSLSRRQNGKSCDKGGERARAWRENREDRA